MTTYRVDWSVSHVSGLNKYKHMSRRGAFKDTCPVGCNEDSFIRGLVVRAKRILDAFIGEGMIGKIEIRRMPFGEVVFEDTISRRIE